MIDQLREENKKLSQQVREATDRADVESEYRRRAEQENDQLRRSKQWLEDQMRDQADIADSLKSVVARCFVGLDKTLPVLEDLRRHASLDRAGTHS